MAGYCPKGLIGERYFDYVNLSCNPDSATALTPGRFVKQLDVVSRAADLNPRGLLKWIVSWAGLSATWFMADVQDAAVALRIGQLASVKLNT